MSLLGDILLALIGAGLSGGNSKGSGSYVGSDLHSPDFIDYSDKWGSNNDHNWNADGDIRWDSYD